MFGLIAAGRPADVTPQVVTEAQYTFQLSSTPAFNHVVVFILPGYTLPAGTAASVYIQTSPSAEFKFVAGIGPGKESAIFKVNSSTPGDAMTDGFVGSGGIVVGIAIEPGEDVDNKLLSLKQAQSTNNGAMIVASSDRITTKQLAKNIIGNAFDFLASFGSDTVPLKAFQAWWTKFEHKIDLDPSFLEKARAG